MNKSEYHLLYVLSEAPVAVAKRRPHGWKVGDILSTPNTTFHATDRFVVLDVNGYGRAIALKISEPSTLKGTNGKCVDMGHKGLGLFEHKVCQNAPGIRMDKIYFEAMIIGGSHGVEDVVIVGHYSEESMLKIIQRIDREISWFQNGIISNKLPHANVSDIVSSTTDNTLAIHTDVETQPTTVFQNFLASSFELERFLDFVQMTFDEVDYKVIRDYLKLPWTRPAEQKNLDCDCDAHQARAKQDKDMNGTRTFLRTWEKMVFCAEKLHLNMNATEVLSHLSHTSLVLGCQPGEPVLHAFVPKPCYIQYLPAELLLGIIESFTQHWDSVSIKNFGLTCRLFYETVNLYLYRSIAISCDENSWNKAVRMLPKHGHLTREIYLEAPDWDRHIRRVYFQHLRAIGDYCPNLERIDLNYPLRVDLSATEADLPPKIDFEGEEQGVEDEGTAVEELDAQMDQDQDDEMQDIVVPDAEFPLDLPTHAIAMQGVATLPVGNGIGQDGQENDQGDGQVADHGEGDGTMVDPAQAALIAQEAAQAQLAAEQARRHAERLAEAQADIAKNKRTCAEIDYIIKSSPRLQNFSIQWTGGPALERFYQKIPKLKALRIWDHVTDQDLVSTAKKCRNLERFYLDGEENRVSLNGLVGFLNSLHTKEKSKLKRIGLFRVAGLTERSWIDPMGNIDGDDDDDYDDDDDDDNDNDNDDGDEGLLGMQVDGGGGNAAAHANIPNVLAQLDQGQSRLHKFIDVLSFKHPFLERLCLVHANIKDDTIPILGKLHSLQSLDISKPNATGLTTVGIIELVSVFKGKSLSSLDLSRHRELSPEDMEILTGGEEGLATLRYIRVKHCPKLKGVYLIDEWVRPEDFVNEDGNWRPRSGAGRSLLEIGDGWKEQWNEEW